MPCCLRHFWIQQGALLTLVELPAFVNPIDLYSLSLCFSNAVVFISLGCYSKIPWTGWLINKNLCLTVLEAGKSKVKMLVDLVSHEGPLPGSGTAIFLVGGAGKLSLAVSFVRC